MTAEIALLNRRALAFAADSAVTISDGVNDKIYNSFEKIFELSRVMPIGLMVYNAVEFVGVPIDVLTRKFRAECDREFSSCEHACKAFLEYLCKFKRTDYDDSDHFSAIISDEIKEIAKGP
jgi:hypothetical protein